MYNTEVKTITKSLPLLRWNTCKSLIFSYSAYFSRIFRKNTTQRCGDFFENRRLDLLFPKPAAIPLHLHDNDWCHRKDHVEERKSERQWNDKFLWSFWVTRLSHTYFWEMDTTSSCKCFGKMEIVYVGTCKTKLYGKSRNGVSFNRLACNRQKETLFLMPYYWDMKGWRATVPCRLDCAIKNGTASCGYKNQPLSARQTKKSPWQYSLEVFQGIPPRIFLAVP